MRQLVQPDLSVVGYIEDCLKYADNVAGLAGGEQTAHLGWLNTQFPHEDAIPTDVAVPCWFDYFSGPDNLGHVVWSVPGQGFYSSPYNKPSGHNVLNSIAQIEQLYSCKYVGWSEDISGLKVVEGGNMTHQQNMDGARTLRLLAGESVAEANTHVENDANHMDADPTYWAGLALQLYNGEWQALAADATKYRQGQVAPKTVVIDNINYVPGGK